MSEINEEVSKEKLIELLEHRSKHSQYQKLPSCLENILEGPQTGKYEKERMDYICEKISIAGNVIDIGGNTGYFSFESLTRGKAEHIDYFEGNKNHAEFVELAARVTGYSEQIHVYNEYYIASAKSKKYDIGYYLNVVHHLGSDYECGIDMNEAKDCMIKEINTLSGYVKILVFQMGFNWGGDANRCLFSKGTKGEMIDYIKEGIKDYWEICHIGVAKKDKNGIYYEDLNDKNIQRDDELGEFLNRPLFIFKAKNNL